MVPPYSALSLNFFLHALEWSIVSVTIQMYANAKDVCKLVKSADFQVLATNQTLCLQRTYFILQEEHGSQSSKT
jgi:hypothetical protein